jgi:uncharacterized phage protein (TIGR02218 family)
MAQFQYGLLTWTSGQNAGLSAGIKRYMASGLVQLAIPMPFPIMDGDGFVIVAGCDKTWQTCSGVYDNLDNFRGEPYVPGVDELVRYAPLDVTLVQAEGEYGQNVPTTPIGGG